MSNPNIKDYGFKPGQSGNPGGRPKKDWTWAGLLAEAMEEELIAKDGSKAKTKQFITKRLVKMAIEGDISAQKEIMNRMDGMPQQNHDLTTNGKDLPIPILNGIYPDNSDKEADTTKEEN